MISAVAGDLGSPRPTKTKRTQGLHGQVPSEDDPSIVKCQWTPAPVIREEGAGQQLHTLAILRHYGKRVILPGIW